MSNILRIGILGSTRGSNLIPLMQLLEEQGIAAQISVVISNKRDAGILDKAKDQDWPHVYISQTDRTRVYFEQLLSEKLKEYKTDLVLLIGYMRILSPWFIQEWSQKIINVHPSLLPAFAGKMDLAVHQAVLDAGLKETGCSVHIVSNDLDAGPILVQKKCSVEADDTATSLKARVQTLEVQALAQAIQQFNSGYSHDSFAC